MFTNNIHFLFSKIYKLIIKYFTLAVLSNNIISNKSLLIIISWVLCNPSKKLIISMSNYLDIYLDEV